MLRAGDGFSCFTNGICCGGIADCPVNERAVLHLPVLSRFRDSTAKHNAHLKETGLPLLPLS